ncbi:MAG TPA: branched-chain amino acid ABC transporter permease [Burkholderiales bacterium]|nr:branched-chain amino acid ABC transporter permease [Burkholderiales bacterium]
MAANSADAAAETAAAYLLRRHRWHWAEALPWLVAIGVFFAFPDYLALGTQILIWVLFTLSLDLVLGYAGVVTLGHAAFFGTGAYAAGLLSARLGWGEPISALAFGALCAAAVGFVSGWVLLRYRGLTLLMLTLATSIMLYELGNARADVTGGFDGLAGISLKPLLGAFDYDLYGRTTYAYALAVLFVLFLVARRIVWSPFGQAVIGIRENVRRMHALGSPVHRRLVTIYTVAAAMAGAAGALHAQTNAFVTLGALGFERSATVVVLLVLGGTGRLYGAFLGAPAYLLLEDLLAKRSPEYWEFGVGLALVLAVLFARRGLLGLLEDAGRALARRRP